MKITGIHALWPEHKGFLLERKNTEPEYIFVHFLTSVYYMEKENEKAIKINPGGCILYAPYSFRHFEARNNDLLHDWFHASGDFEKIIKKYGLETNKIYYPGSESGITEIIQELELENLRKQPFEREICDLKLEELFAKIARGLSENVKKSFIDNSTREKFIELRGEMHTHYYEIDNIEGLAKKVSLSLSRFYTVYRQIFGISPKQDLLNIRLEHAKQLLLQNQYPVSVIAEKLGYNNQYHFIRQFKAATGITPGKFRNNF